MPSFVKDSAFFFYPFMKKLLTGILCCFSAVVMAQTKGVVAVVKDPMIDSLIAKRIELNLKPVTTGTPGSVSPVRPGTAIVSQMKSYAYELAGKQNRAVDPPLLLCIDEAANIAVHRVEALGVDIS